MERDFCPSILYHVEELRRFSFYQILSKENATLSRYERNYFSKETSTCLFINVSSIYVLRDDEYASCRLLQRSRSHVFDRFLLYEEKGHDVAPLTRRVFGALYQHPFT